MATRADITKKYAREYTKADKQLKGVILDEVMDVTGWSRANARRRLAQARVTGVARRKPGPRPGTHKYGYDVVKVLQHVWAVSGGMCGKYLKAAMPVVLNNMEAHHQFGTVATRYTPDVRTGLESMSAATIDRYLKPVKDKDPLRGKTTTTPGSMLRNSISIRKASDEIVSEPGFFETDTVAHCGPTLKGEFARTVNMTDLNIGWTFTTTIRNNARVHMIAALDLAVATIPYPVQGLDCDNGSEFINHDVVAWAAGKDLCFTRSRPYKKNDQAAVESKNNHVVRRYGMYWRYDTPRERTLLNQLWPLVDDRLNYFTPTTKPVGWSTDEAGRRRRVYDTPATPLDRLIASGILSITQQEQLLARRDSLDLAGITRHIHDIQQQLIRLAAAPTRQLEHNTTPHPPDTTGIKLTSKKP